MTHPPLNQSANIGKINPLCLKIMNKQPYGELFQPNDNSGRHESHGSRHGIFSDKNGIREL